MENQCALIGYSLLTIVYTNNIQANLHNPMFLVGNILIVLGYLLLATEKYNIVYNGEHEEESSHQISKGNAILTLFYTSSIFLKINEHSKMTDGFALIAHSLLTKEINEQTTIAAYASYLIYYLNYAKHHSVMEDNMEKIQFVGGCFLALYCAISLEKLVNKNKT